MAAQQREKNGTVYFVLVQVSFHGTPQSSEQPTRIRAVTQAPPLMTASRTVARHTSTTDIVLHNGVHSLPSASTVHAVSGGEHAVLRW
jgi:hypothetical protein